MLACDFSVCQDLEISLFMLLLYNIIEWVSFTEPVEPAAKKSSSSGSQDRGKFETNKQKLLSINGSYWVV